MRRSSTISPIASSPGARSKDRMSLTQAWCISSRRPAGAAPRCVSRSITTCRAASSDSWRPSCSAKSRRSWCMTICVRSSKCWRRARWCALTPPRWKAACASTRVGRRKATRSRRESHYSRDECANGKEDAVMKANCWHGKKSVRVEDVPDPRIMNSRDAIVRITSTAICGSDLHLYNGFVPSMEKGDVLGHEFMGEVMEVGSAVKNLKPGDRVVVPFPLACGSCTSCLSGLYSLCENSNPNAWMAEERWGHSPAGIFGYSHMLGGYAGGQAEYARVPFADVGPIKVPPELSDEQVLFLSDIFPTGYMGAEICDSQPGDIVAVWGCGPGGQFAIKSAFLLGAERVIAIDRYEYRLRMAREECGAETINYEEVDSVPEALNEMTGGRGPDACIDAVGMEAHGHGAMYAYDRVKQAVKAETDRPIALREAITACRNGGTVSIIGVYGGFIDKFPMGSLMNRSLTIRSGQCHVHRYMQPLRDHIQEGDIDPSFVVTHRMRLDEAPNGYDIFLNKENDCMKVVLKVRTGVYIAVMLIMLRNTSGSTGFVR